MIAGPEIFIIRYQIRILALAVSLITCSSAVYCQQGTPVSISPEVNIGRAVSFISMAPYTKDVTLSTQLIIGSQPIIKAGSKNKILDNRVNQGKDKPMMVLIPVGRLYPAVSKWSGSLCNCEKMLGFLKIFSNNMFHYSYSELNNKRVKLFWASRVKKAPAQFTIRKYFGFSYDKKTKHETFFTICEVYEYPSENSSVKQLNYRLNNYIV